MGVKANRVAGVRDCWDTRRPGDYTFTGRQGKKGIYGMAFVCPCGCGDVSGIDFDTVEGNGPKWTWNGDQVAPTLTPSLHKIHDCGWHGWLRNGVFESV